jgi:hypothetical protein
MIREAIELLMGEGMLFSTIDDLVSFGKGSSLTPSMSRARRMYDKCVVGTVYIMHPRMPKRVMDMSSRIL